MRGENVWLTQKMMGTLYDVETHTVNYHLKKVVANSELQEDSVIRNFRITAADGKNYDTKIASPQSLLSATRSTPNAQCSFANGRQRFFRTPEK